VESFDKTGEPKAKSPKNETIPANKDGNLLLLKYIYTPLKLICI
jgi:hypothetical protein